MTALDARRTSRRPPRRSGSSWRTGATRDVAKREVPERTPASTTSRRSPSSRLAYDDVARFLEEVTLFGDPAGEDRSRGRRRTSGSSCRPSTRPRGSSGRPCSSSASSRTASRTCARAGRPRGWTRSGASFYVAVTRAKDELTLVHPLSAYDRYGLVVVTEASRFLRELPEGLYERWVLEEGAAPPLPPGPQTPRLGAGEGAATADPTAAPDDDEPVN